MPMSPACIAGNRRPCLAGVLLVIGLLLAALPLTVAADNRAISCGSVIYHADAEKMELRHFRLEVENHDADVMTGYAGDSPTKKWPLCEVAPDGRSTLM